MIGSSKTLKPYVPKNKLKLVWELQYLAMNILSSRRNVKIDILQIRRMSTKMADKNTNLR